MFFLASNPRKAFRGLEAGRHQRWMKSAQKIEPHAAVMVKPFKLPAIPRNG
jgi:hypothetical protein